jgi:hypothetical protein
MGVPAKDGPTTGQLRVTLTTTGHGPATATLDTHCPSWLPAAS